MVKEVDTIYDRSNVFYDTFNEVRDTYTECKRDVWAESNTIVLYDTNAETGLFDMSDIIIAYSDDGKPAIITERIYRKNYKFWDWVMVRRILKSKMKYLEHELGFNMSVTYSKDFIDYVHYKEWWWEWAKRNQQKK